MYECDAKVINVIDGDTIDCVVDVGYFITTTHRFRLLGVNCPEVHGPTRAEGLKAAEYTRNALLGKTVRLRSAKSDDFGRWLCQIYVGDVDFNQSLVDRGLAVPFMVGKVAGPGAATVPESGPLPERWHERLVFDPEVCADSPCVKGTWVTVRHVISLLVDDWNWADIIRAHPELTTDDIRTCLEYAVAVENGDASPAGEWDAT